ncbi:hypothetical protein D9M70_484740 [compost metagenome]
MVDDERGAEMAHCFDRPDHILRRAMDQGVPAIRADALDHRAHATRIEGIAETAHQADAYAFDAPCSHLRQQRLVHVRRNHGDAAIRACARIERSQQRAMVTAIAGRLHDHAVRDP